MSKAQLNPNGLENQIQLDYLRSLHEVKEIKQKIQSVDDFKIDVTDRISRLEARYEHIMKSIDDIKKDSSLNVKLTVGIILALIGAAISVLLKTGG